VWQLLVVLCICYVTRFGVVLCWVFGVVALECGVTEVFMIGGVFRRASNIMLGIWCVRRSNVYCSSILRKCKSVLLC